MLQVSSSVLDHVVQATWPAPVLPLDEAMKDLVTHYDHHIMGPLQSQELTKGRREKDSERWSALFGWQNDSRVGGPSIMQPVAGRYISTVTSKPVKAFTKHSSWTDSFKGGLHMQAVTWPVSEASIRDIVAPVKVPSCETNVTWPAFEHVLFAKHDKTQQLTA